MDGQDKAGIRLVLFVVRSEASPMIKAGAYTSEPHFLYGMKHLLLVSALALAVPAAYAAVPLEQKGVAEPSVQSLSTYGLQVPTRSALKSLLPKGWRLFVHKSATLPETLSWKPGDSWTQLLTDAAIATGTAVLVDWEDRAVYIRSPQVALEEGARRAEIAQAAATPMPRLTERAPVLAAAVPAAVAPAAPAAPLAPEPVVLAAAPAPLSEVPVPLPAAATADYEQGLLRPPAIVAYDRPAPVLSGVDAAGVLEASGPMQALAVGLAKVPDPAPEAAPALMAALQAMRENDLLRAQPLSAPKAPPQEVAQAAPPTPVKASAAPASASNVVLPLEPGSFRLTEPMAANKPMLRHVLQALADRHNLPFVWLAPNELRMPGPVTLLGVNAAQDLHLVKRALGPQAAVTLGFGPAGLRAESTDQNWLTTHLQEKADRAQALAVAQGRMARVGVQPSGYQQAAVMQLTVEAGQPLEYAVAQFLSKHGYTMDWAVSGGFEASRTLSFEGATLAETLGQVLPALGVSADIYTADNHVIVRPGTYQE